MSTFTVTNTNDSGFGSLRAGISSANSIPGSTINFSVTGIITITGPEMLITASTTINGPGASILNIQRTVGMGRIFNSSTAGITINISGLTISGGNVPGSAIANRGGAISITGANLTLNINNCIIQNNTSGASGGAIFSSSSAILSVAGTTFRNNLSSGTGGGGAVNSLSTNTCTFIGCRFDTNISTASAGALFLNSSSLVATLTDCLIENNTSSGVGGGMFILNINTVNMTRCTFYNNNSNVGSGGGGVFMQNAINATINNCTFDSNGTLVDGGGGLRSNTNTRIFNSTFSNNSAETFGGGIFLSGSSSKTIINCTVSGNFAETSGGGIYLSGATNTTIIGSTISNNTATTSAGGVFLTSSSTLTIGNTVVALNPILSIPDFAFGSGTDIIVSLGNNFIGNATGTGTSFTQPGDQTGSDPFLLPLGNYGGQTKTMLPVSFISPLIDTGSNTLVTTYYIIPELLDTGMPIDQRGFSRIVNGSVDIGAVETGDIICFSGDSLVLTKNILTNKIEIICAKNVIAGIHEVFDTNENLFIPVKHNVINGPVTRLWKIAKDSLGKNQPNDDFLVTGGHNIVVNGIIMKARDIPQAKRIKVKNEKVYSICTEKQVPILINGLNVMTWSDEKFIKYAKKKNIMWKNAIPMEKCLFELDNL